MSFACSAWSLIAQAPRADQFVKGFRDNHLNRGSSDNWLLFGVIALAAVVGCYILQRFLRPKATGPVCCARRLFRDLCRLHNLNHWNSNLLSRLAKRNGVDPAHMFLRPDLFAAANPAELQLSQKLFG